MYGILIIFAAIVIIAALVLTFSVIKDVNKKIKRYEEVGDSLTSEVERSHKYESDSIKSNIKSLTWIYVFICIALIAVSLVFVFVF